MVQQRRDPGLARLSRRYVDPRESGWQRSPALCPVPRLLVRVVLGSRPSLRFLRRLAARAAALAYRARSGKQHSSLEARVFELFDAEDQHCEAEADWCVEDHPCEAGRDFRWELLVPLGFEPLQCNHWEEARKLL
jgi:hypothetical protein